MDTLLFVPHVAFDTSPRAAEQPPQRVHAYYKGLATSAEIVEQTTCKDAGVEGRLELKQVEESILSTEVEAQLETAGNVLLVIICIGAFFAFGSAIYNLFGTEELAKGVFWLGVGFVAVVLGFAIRLLFRAGAEIIRLLKISNRSIFTGKITQLSVHRGYKCSACNAAVQPGQVRCSRCGAKFKP